MLNMKPSMKLMTNFFTGLDSSHHRLIFEVSVTDGGAKVLKMWDKAYMCGLSIGPRDF